MHLPTGNDDDDDDVRAAAGQLHNRGAVVLWKLHKRVQRAVLGVLPLLVPPAPQVVRLHQRRLLRTFGCVQGVHCKRWRLSPAGRRGGQRGRLHLPVRDQFHAADRHNYASAGDDDNVECAIHSDDAGDHDDVAV